MLAMLKNRLPFAVPDWRVANAELVAYPMLEDSDCDGHPARFVHARLGRAAELGGFAESFATALAALHAVPGFRRRGCGMLIRYTDAGRQKVRPTTLTASDAEFVVNDKAPPLVAALARRRIVVCNFSMVVHGRSLRGPCALSTTRSASAG